MRLFFYLLKEITYFFTLSLFAMSGIELFILLINELSEVGEGHYTFVLSLVYCFLELPARLYEFLPINLFMSALFALGELANHNELVVMQSSGLTQRRLFIYTVLWAICLGLSAAIFFETISPWSQRLANTTKNLAISEGNFLQHGKTVWFKESNFYIHIADLIDQHTFRKVTIYEINGKGKLISASAMLWLKYINHGWKAFKYRKTIFEKNMITQRRFEHIILPLHLEGAWFQHRNSEELVEEISLPELAKRILQLHENHIDISGWLYHFYQRASRPLAAIILLILAVPFTLGSMRQKSFSARLSLGLMVGISYYFINKFCYVAGMLYRFDPIIINFIPIFFFALVTHFFWKRMVK